MAKMKICIDAGHYGKYNRSPANGKYYESDMAWKLHLLQKKYLEAYGFEVITTRNNQGVDRSLYSRGTASDGCVLFISDHSNAVGSGVNEAVDYPVVYVPLNHKGDVLGLRLAKCIESVMGTAQKGRIASRKSSTGGEYYGVIRGAVAVGTIGMIVEHSFHTNTRSTYWLLDEKNLDKLAQAEAKVIAEYFGVETADKEPVIDNNKDEEKLVVDGIWGVKTTRKAQQVFGTPVDGIISNQLKEYKKYFPGILDETVEWNNKGRGGSALVEAIQHMVDCEEDGYLGKETAKAMQKYFGTAIDGVFDKPSPLIKAFQTWLNKQ